MNVDNSDLVRQFLRECSGKPKTPELLAKYVDDPVLRAHVALWDRAFPAYSLDIEDIVANGNTVALRVTFKGVHRGEFMGIAPTGASVEAGGMIFYRFQDGKIVEHWINADSLAVLQQLGAIPGPEPGALPA